MTDEKDTIRKVADEIRARYTLYTESDYLDWCDRLEWLAAEHEAMQERLNAANELNAEMYKTLKSCLDGMTYAMTYANAARCGDAIKERMQ